MVAVSDATRHHGGVGGIDWPIQDGKGHREQLVDFVFGGWGYLGGHRTRCVPGRVLVGGGALWRHDAAGVVLDVGPSHLDQRLVNVHAKNAPGL